jgi:hypothetical protein
MPARLLGAAPCVDRFADPVCLTAEQMATAVDNAPRNTVGNQREDMGARTVPIITTPKLVPSMDTLSTTSDAGEPMDITTPTPTDNITLRTSSKTPDGDGSDGTERNSNSSPHNNGLTSTGSTAMPAPAVAAAAVHAPKIVQTAFIHKLYKYESNARKTKRTWVANGFTACWKTPTYSI